MSADRILSQILSSPAAAGLAGGVAGGLLTSKAGRKLGTKALNFGGIAAVGGLAYAAWRNYRETTSAPLDAAPAERPSAAELDRFVPAAEHAAESETLGATLLQAMIAAARADGRLDGEERLAIYDRIASLPLSDAEKADLFAQLDKPVDIDSLVRSARTPEIAAEIYAASLLAIEADTPAERAHLALLAARLRLPEALVDSIHREAGVDLHAAGSARS